MVIICSSLVSSINYKKLYHFTQTYTHTYAHMPQRPVPEKKAPGALGGPSEVLPTGTESSIIRDGHEGEEPRAQTWEIVSMPSTARQQIWNVFRNGVSEELKGMV